ncbi:Lysine-specific demethylase 8 [Thoreauomyces humboldtii]|nr:Lysine-specific demethylase 8 [Thoreauomyces humboldtii]
MSPSLPQDVRLLSKTASHALEALATAQLSQHPQATERLFDLAVRALRIRDYGAALHYADAAVDLAHEQLLSYPHRAVPQAPRVAFTVASILKALAYLGPVTSPPTDHGGAEYNAQPEPIVQAIRSLDVALLKAGRIAHEAVIDSLIQAMMAYLAVPTISEPLASQDPTADEPTIAFQVPQLTVPPLTEFASHLVAQTPILIQGALTHWPALSDRPWSDRTYLRSAAGEHRVVPVELGKDYTDQQWTQKLMPFGEFLDVHVFGPRDASKPVGYLAQHDLFAQIPRLAEDIVVPDYCYVDPGDDDDDPMPDVATNAWIGPEGTISPLHTDPKNNLFAQVVGRKYVRLYSPKRSDAVYPHDQSSMLGNTSQVNVEEPDLDAFPLFAKAPYLETLIGPGELLFIPVGWWHYVRSLSPSISVSFWF